MRGEKDVGKEGDESERLVLYSCVESYKQLETEFSSNGDIESTWTCMQNRNNACWLYLHVYQTDTSQSVNTTARNIIQVNK